ncbi:MAG: apolipoprotein N-acyltransferase [Alphaproteobacteria bacterium]|nr:apolipoprotein N-acyltransferase [Alphaproteobacteria bacterium]
MFENIFKTPVISKYVNKNNKSISIKCFGFGALGALGFAPFNLYPVFIAVIAWLFVNISENRLSLKNSFFFFLVFYIFNLYWLAFPLTINFSRHFVLIPFAIIFIPGICAMEMQIPIIAIQHVRNLTAKTIIFSFLFSIVLHIQRLGEFGFPWVFPAYIWNSHEIFLQTLVIYGVNGLNFVTVFMASLIGAFIVSYNRNANNLKYILSAAIFFFSICLFGLIRLANNPTKYTNYHARIVQPNIKNEEKKQRKNIMNRLQYLSRNLNNIDFLIWPEASIPYLYSERLKGLNDLLSESLVPNAYLIAGAIREDVSNANSIYNSVIVIDYFGHNIYNYNKIHLVPFGEYIPFRYLIPFESIASDIGDFNIGRKHSSFQLNNLKIATLICYEAIFASECAIAAKDADLIINLTNDGWFGLTSQPYQHLQIVRARAIELGIPLIRTANVGISAVFDPLGRMLHHIPIDTTGYIDIAIPKKLNN